MTPYTAYRDIQGIIYQDDMDINRLMRTDELHKFSDGTLNHIRTSLNDIATGIQIEYLPKRKSTKQDKQRARVMIKAIDKKLKYRRLMRSLEKFVKSVLKSKNFKKDATLKLFKSTNQERYEHVGPEVTSSQDGKTRLCLVDDLKVFKITISLTSQDKGTSSCLKLKDTITYSQDKRHEVYELKTKDKA
ncbi:hypothetical protein Tco_0080045 [Tanacetum coccineum]